MKCFVIIIELLQCAFLIHVNRESSTGNNNLVLHACKLISVFLSRCSYISLLKGNNTLPPEDRLLKFLVDTSADAEETVQCANCDQESNKKVETSKNNRLLCSMYIILRGWVTLPARPSLDTKNFVVLSFFFVPFPP